VGSTIVVGSCNGLIHGVDKVTGKARWEYNARSDGGRPEFHSSSLMVGDLLMLSSDDRRPEGIGYVYAIEASTGLVRWKTHVGRGSMTDIVQFNSRLYIVTLDDELIALDAANGKQAWSFRGAPPLDNDPFYVIATPAVNANQVYFGGTDGVVSALSADSGVLLWKSEIGSRIMTSLVLVSNTLCLGTRDGRLLQVDLSNGKLKGEIRLDQMPIGPLIITGNSILVFSLEGQSLVLNALDTSLTGVRWHRRAERGWSSSRPYLCRESVLAGSEDGELAALAIEDGNTIWSRHLNGVIAGIRYDEDLLYVGTVRGILFAVQPPMSKR
jgi:eukaryotic-like serine/threonine-protein kinase